MADRGGVCAEEGLKGRRAFSLHKKGVAAPRAASAARVSAPGSGRTEGDGAGGCSVSTSPA